MKQTSVLLLILLAVFLHARSSVAQEETKNGNQSTGLPVEPLIAEASDEAKNAMQVFQMPDGVTSSVFAAEPMVANPVVIDIDSQGRLFVCESYRQEKGVEDNRNHPEWLNDDLAAKTVSDRLAYIREHLGEDAVEYTRQDDRIRLLTDIDGDGTADESVVFASGFNSIEEGTGAGVLALRGAVYFTCIPRLWKLIDRDNDGEADSRNPLLEGFGVRFAFRGHDLHGLIVGPDGRLYFSIGDRGYHINDKISDPGSGAVFRCELDGSKLEVVATGLRNPQELAFDDFGNLFTGDNNSDSGDRARMVYVVEGSDSGWRMAYQYLPDRGPFNREKIWHPYDPKTTPAYIVPPIDNFADGPSGFCFYPGTGFSKHMKDRFLLCDFRGQTSGSGVKTFRLKPKGAFYEIADEENSFWNLLATDCCFGPDGRLYISDWVHGWDGIGKGRVYAFEDSGGNVMLKREVRELLATDWRTQNEARLIALLGHEDRRIRMESQFELARRRAYFPLSVVAQAKGEKLLARIHAMWAVDQISRRPLTASHVKSQYLQLLMKLLKDADSELQAQAARLIGDLVTRERFDSTQKLEVVSGLQDLVKSENARVRYFATISLGKLPHLSTIDVVLDLIAKNNNVDPMLRHAGIMALRWQATYGSDQILRAAAVHDSAAVRLAAVVALRKLYSERKHDAPTLVSLLNDENEAVVIEAARAIYDLPIPGLLPKLGELSSGRNLPDPLARRVLNANFRVGDEAALQRIGDFVLDKSQILARRLEAIEMLAEWRKPPPLDKVLGMWRPVSARQIRFRFPDNSRLLEFFNESDSLPDQLADQLLEVIADAGILEAEPRFRQIFENDTDLNRRLTALRGLLAFRGGGMEEIINEALQSGHAELRMAAIEYLVESQSSAAAGHLEKAIDSQSTSERQTAMKLLGKMNDEASAGLLLDRFTDFPSIPADTQLDLVLAMQNRKETKLNQAISKFIDSGSEKNPRFQYQLTRHGGNADSGSEIFFNRGDVSCLRCHKIGASGGDVGPNLTDIGTKRDRDYLLESLVEPSKTITENFETVVVLDVDGKTHVGVTKASTDETLSIMTADAIMVNIPQEDIEEIRRGKSAMPDDVTKHLTLAEMRDLIEFLAIQKQQPESEK